MAKKFADWEKEAIKCIRCGACQNVCPIFNELRSEATVARGKVCLIRTAIKDEIEITDKFAQLISQCLLCKACVVNCPSGVQTDKLVEIARNEIVERKGLHVLKKLILRTGLKNKRLFHSSLKMGSIFQRILFRPGPGGQGMLPRLPLGLDKRRLLKPLAPKTLREKYPEVVKVEHHKGRVAFFTGCMMNYIYTAAGSAIIEVLTKNGYEVVIPAQQHCCGTPARVNGEQDTAIEMAKANLDVFADLDVDAVITGCASCGLAVKEEYQELVEDYPQYLAKAAKLAAKMKDFSEFIAITDSWAQELGKISLSVTYHDPCHLARGQDVRKQPRLLIDAIPGVELKELPRSEQCCGSAGSYCLDHYDISKQINDKKINDIQATGAGNLVTSCLACQMHIEDGLNRNNLGEVKCMHIAELLNKAYEKAGVVPSENRSSSMGEKNFRV